MYGCLIYTRFVRVSLCTDNTAAIRPPILFYITTVVIPDGQLWKMCCAISDPGVEGLKRKSFVFPLVSKMRKLIYRVSEGERDGEGRRREERGREGRGRGGKGEGGRGGNKGGEGKGGKGERREDTNIVSMQGSPCFQAPLQSYFFALETRERGLFFGFLLAVS